MEGVVVSSDVRLGEGAALNGLHPDRTVTRYIRTSSERRRGRGGPTTPLFGPPSRTFTEGWRFRELQAGGEVGIDVAKGGGPET